jgi:TolB protein
MAGLLAVGMSAALGLMGAGCSLCENLDCDPGGGGGVGGGEVDFTRGLVLVRDGDLLVADRADYSQTAQLTSGGSFRHPTVSPDGRVVVAAAADGSALVRVPTAGGASATLLRADATYRGLRNPVFTPDGTRVLFVYDSGAASSVGSVAADGTGGVRAVVGGGSTAYGSPSFDRTGRLFVATGPSAFNLNRLVQVNPSTGVTVGASLSLGTSASRVVNRAEVSPDGTRIAFDGEIASGAVRLFVVSSSGGAASQLNLGPGNQAWPTWTGDTTLAFASETGGGAESIYTVPASGGSAELAVPSGTEPSFGPRG